MKLKYYSIKTIDSWVEGSYFLIKKKSSLTKLERGLKKWYFFFFLMRQLYMCTCLTGGDVDTISMHK